jgi:cytochrome c-type biogenesis protein CcmH
MVGLARLRRGIASVALATASLLAVTTTFAKDAAPAAADPALEARVLRLSAELRCLVCQNQTIADSNADLANDLRRQVREMLAKGASDREVIDYMTARYGDFVLYRPPVKSTTLLLWAGPAVLLVGGLSVLALVLRRRSRMPDSAFDRDEDDGKAPSTGPGPSKGTPATPGAAAGAE